MDCCVLVEVIVDRCGWYDKDGTFYEKEVVLGQKIERAYNYFPIDFAINNITVRCSALAHY